MFMEYFEAGYSVIPVITQTAAPFEKEWSKWASIRQSESLIEEYEQKYKIPQHGVGLLLGPIGGVVGLDIDSESKDILDMCPPSPVRKRGSKGETRFYRPGPGVVSVTAKRKNTGPNTATESQEGIELLASGRQTVMPPSINRKTQKPYFWVTTDTLLDVKPQDLPIITVEEVQKIISYIQNGKITSAEAQPSGDLNAGRNDALTKTIWALLHAGDMRSDQEIATELLGIDFRTNTPPYFSDVTELWNKKARGNPYNAALLFTQYHRKQLAKKGSIDPRKDKVSLEMTGSDGNAILGQGIDESSRFKIWEALKIEVNPSSGTPRSNFDSAHKIISGIPRIKSSIWYDEFYCAIMTNLGQESGPGRPWHEADTLNLMKYAQSVVGLSSIGKEAIFDAVVYHARENKKHCVREWLESLPEWDGVPRVQGFLPSYFGAADNDYTRQVGQNFLVSLIARVMEPGCKADCMIILEGIQGLLKSSALRALAGEQWFGELTVELENKDALMITQGKWLVEIPELDSIVKAEPEAVKRYLSTQTDRFRPPYGRFVEEFPRQFISAGTTNAHDYLKDQTGGRRFWPVACQKVDLDGIRRDREQLFSEALAALKLGCEFWIVPESAKEEVDARTERDPWEDILRHWLIGKTEQLTIPKIADDCFSIPASGVHSGVSRRIASIMRRSGWVHHRDMTRKYWVRG